MRFIQLNFKTGEVKIFNFERIREVNGQGNQVEIILHGDEEPIDFDFDIQEFSNKAFTPDDAELEGKSDIEIVRINENHELPFEEEEGVEDLGY